MDSPERHRIQPRPLGPLRTATGAPRPHSPYSPQSPGRQNRAPTSIFNTSSHTYAASNGLRTSNLSPPPTSPDRYGIQSYRARGSILQDDTFDMSSSSRRSATQLSTLQPLSAEDITSLVYSIGLSEIESKKLFRFNDVSFWALSLVRSSVMFTDSVNGSLILMVVWPFCMGNYWPSAAARTSPIVNSNLRSRKSDRSTNAPRRPMTYLKNHM